MTQEVMLETNANAKDVPKNNLNNNSVEFITVFTSCNVITLVLVFIFMLSVILNISIKYFRY